MNPEAASDRVNALHPAWHALRHAPRARRAELLTLFELGEQIDEIPERIREPGIAALKLAWWRDEIGRIEAGKARHPLGQRVGALLSAEALSWLRDLIEVQEQRLAPTPTANTRQWLELAGQRAAVERIAAALCGGDDASARRVGQFRCLVDELNRIGAPLRRGRCPLPLDLPAKQLLELPDAEFNQAVAAILSELKSLATPPPRATPALLRALHGETRALYRTIRENPAACRRHKTLLTPLALFWHGWRGVLLAK